MHVAGSFIVAASCGSPCGGVARRLGGDDGNSGWVILMCGRTGAMISRWVTHMSTANEQITRLLRAIDGGESGAAEELFPLVYDELRSRAGKLMAGERRDHTLQRTALVHEAYLRLVGSGSSFQTRLHFFNAAALAMRRENPGHKSGGLTNWPFDVKCQFAVSGA